MSFSFKSAWKFGQLRPLLTKTRIACSVMLATTALLFACSEDPETPPDGGDPNPPDIEQGDSTSKPQIEYMTFKTSSAHDLEITLQTDTSYKISTTGEDPYISTNPLTKSNPADSVVLSI